MSRTKLNALPMRFPVLILILTICAACFAKESSRFSNVHIKNFGQMDDRFYRGGQPSEEDYKDLAALGITTIIDLRDDAKSYEKPAVEALGMRYVNIPMDDKSYPKAEHVEAFLKLVNDPQTGKFFVHCAGGRHRTGVMGAVYRFNLDGWDYDRAYAEMKQYDFYTSWGHGPMKRFVQDYWQQFQAQKGVAASDAAGASN
jgi:protein tyrosine/serine phosphatase